MARKRNKYLVPPEVGERIYPDGQDMDHEKDGTEERQKVVQFVIEQAGPAAG